MPHTCEPGQFSGPAAQALNLKHTLTLTRRTRVVCIKLRSIARSSLSRTRATTTTATIATTKSPPSSSAPSRFGGDGGGGTQYPRRRNGSHHSLAVNPPKRHMHDDVAHSCSAHLINMLHTCVCARGGLCGSCTCVPHAKRLWHFHTRLWLIPATCHRPCLSLPTVGNVARIVASTVFGCGKHSPPGGPAAYYRRTRANHIINLNGRRLDINIARTQAQRQHMCVCVSVVDEYDSNKACKENQQHTQTHKKGKPNMPNCLSLSRGAGEDGRRPILGTCRNMPFY